MTLGGFIWHIIQQSFVYSFQTKHVLVTCNLLAV